MEQVEQVEQTVEQQTPVAEVAQQPSLSPEALLALLCEQFPKCFIARGECRPLKIGILDSLAARTAGQPGVSKTRLREVLRRYTNTTRYLQGVAAASKRVDLDGEDAGDVAEDHVSHAQQQLAERRERHKAEAKARARAAGGEQGEGERPRRGRPQAAGDSGAAGEQRRGPRPPQRERRPQADGDSRRSRAELPRREAQSAAAPVVRDSVSEMAADNQPLTAAQLVVNQRVKVQTGARPVYGTVVAMQGDNVQVGLDNGLSVWVKSEALSLATARS
ncbi:MAG: RNA chaperone ProQ [Gammaproteobacteria bacterium]|nr:RNA chaperone ProQ [Gammaproteobacteria bacterium]